MAQALEHVVYASSQGVGLRVSFCKVLMRSEKVGLLMCTHLVVRGSGSGFSVSPDSVGALIIRIAFCGKLYYSYNKALIRTSPNSSPQNSIGNY